MARRVAQDMTANTRPTTTHVQLGRLLVLTQWSLGRYGWGRWHLCPANVERTIYAGELDVALCGARPNRGAVVREQPAGSGLVPVERLCPRCVGAAVAATHGALAIPIRGGEEGAGGQ